MVCWLAPGHYYPWVSFQNEALAALAAMLFAFAALTQGDRSLRWPVPATIVSLVTLVPIVQWASGQIRFHSDAFLTGVYLWTLVVALAVGAASANTESRRALLDGVFGALLAAAIASTGLALVQWLGLGPIGYVNWVPAGERPIGNIAQANHLAALCALALVASVWFYETQRISGGVLLLSSAWLTIGMTATRSRMIWVAAAAVCVGWILLRQRAKTRLSSRAVLCWLTGFAALVLAWGPLSQSVDTLPPLSMGERVQGGGGRLRIWATLVDGLLQSPWLGYGWSQVSRAGLAGSTSHVTGETMLRNSHNVVLDILIWNGIPLGLLILSAIAWWWWRQFKACNNAERGVALAALGIVAVHCLFEFPLEYLYFLVPTGLLVGLLEAWGAPPTVALPRLPRAASAMTVTLLSAALVWIGVEYLKVEEGSRENRMLAAGYAQSASLPDVVLLDEPRDYMLYWRTEAAPGMSVKQLAWMADMAGRNPAPPTLLRYATALGLNGRPEDARRTLVQLCNMHKAVRCDEGRASWTLLQQRFEVLRSIPYPATPAV